MYARRPLGVGAQDLEPVDRGAVTGRRALWLALLRLLALTTPINRPSGSLNIANVTMPRISLTGTTFFDPSDSALSSKACGSSAWT
jgi:hypothetical protein